MTDNHNMEMDEDEQRIIVDLGSGVLKLGFSSEDAPRAVYPNVIGYPRKDHKRIIQGATQEEIYIGHEAIEKAGMCSLFYPLEDGEVRDIEQLKRTLEHGFFNELRVDTKNKYMLLTEAPANPRQNREKLVDMVFNDFNAKGVYIAMQAVLALYASGRTTGLVLDVGDGCTHTCPIYQGFCIVHSVFKQKVAGRHVTNQLVKLIDEYCGYGMDSQTSGKMITEKIKKEVCFVSENYQIDLDNTVGDNESGDATSVEYILPDGTRLMLKRPRFMAPECLFSPLLAGLEGKGTMDLIKASFDKTDVNIRSEIINALVLSGGTTMLSFYDRRIGSGVKEHVLHNQAQKHHIIVPKERQFSVWIGGSILASLSTFQNSWLTKAEYADRGAQAIHGKCLGAGSD